MKSILTINRISSINFLLCSIFNTIITIHNNKTICFTFPSSFGSCLLLWLIKLYLISFLIYFVISIMRRFNTLIFSHFSLFLSTNKLSKFILTVTGKCCGFKHSKVYNITHVFISEKTQCLDY